MHYFISDFDTNFARKVGSKDKKIRKKRLSYNTLSKDTKDYNTNYLYHNMFGGDKAVKDMAKTGVPYKVAKQYHLDVARQYDKDSLNGGDANKGLNSVNQKYSKYFNNTKR
jgi:hypothetical protein